MGYSTIVSTNKILPSSIALSAYNIFVARNLSSVQFMQPRMISVFLKSILPVDSEAIKPGLGASPPQKEKFFSFIVRSSNSGIPACTLLFNNQSFSAINLPDPSWLFNLCCPPINTLSIFLLLSPSFQIKTACLLLLMNKTEHFTISFSAK